MGRGRSERSSLDLSRVRWCRKAGAFHISQPQRHSSPLSLDELRTCMITIFTEYTYIWLLFTPRHTK